MFTKILIANRGEIACRVARTARRMGIRTVAVYSDADAGAAHVAACDEAYRLGPPPPRESYLNAARILEIARACGAQAIHPGYGFLSENEGFARACADAGVVFIGPPPSAIAAMGSKSAAKSITGKAGVPLVPGYHGDDQDPALLAREAARIGFPVLIKATAGGGGKGMKIVRSAAEFDGALASARREAQAGFGDDRVLIEKYLTSPRHIEIQVFGDAHGRAVSLFERDCSVQRRHQKVLEEAPAPGMTAERRRAMGDAAVAAAQAIGYVGAGTVEFIAEQDGTFYFMEMNTRLQVEHPVTEMITGQDLVEWQLRVASGEHLPAAQGQLAIRGHAIEARLCAENPDADFLPATGTLDVARWPAHAAFEHSEVLPRIDRGFDEGDTISPWYDSMIAKLIVWGEDRAQALARLDAALRDTHLVGLHNNVAFLRRVVKSRAFATADLDTALIERERPALFETPGLASEVAAAGVAALAQAEERALETADPWSRRDGWRLHGSARRRFDLVLGGEPLAVAMTRLHDGATVLELGAQRWPFTATAHGAGVHEVTLGERRLRLSVYRAGERFAVFASEGSALLTEVDSLAHAGDGAAEGRLSAPMPGKVISLAVKAGDAVKKGQAVAVMEAMMMEHTLHAPRDGEVGELLCTVGDQLAEGAELIRLLD